MSVEIRVARSLNMALIYLTNNKGGEIPPKNL